MEPNERLTQLESEIKILKNEVQAVLLDLRDRYLETENPFNAAPAAVSRDEVIIETRPAESKAAETQPSGSDGKAIEQDEPPAPIPADEKTVQHEAAHENVNRQRMTERNGHEHPRTNHDAKIDLVTIGGLARWADDSVKTLGRTRTETILDISEMMGFLSRDLKLVMTKLVNVEADGNGDGIQAREYLNSLIGLTALLGRDNRTEQTLLSIMSGEDDHR